MRTLDLEDNDIITAYSPRNDGNKRRGSHKLARDDHDANRRNDLSDAVHSLCFSAVGIILHARVKRRARAKRARYTIPHFFMPS